MTDRDQSGSGRQSSEDQSEFEKAIEASDVARQFGAEIDVTGPPADETGFFLVKRYETVDPQTFRSWLLERVGGEESVLLETPSGIFVVWMQFGAARRLRQSSMVALVGGVSVDINRLQTMLQPVDSI